MVSHAILAALCVAGGNGDWSSQKCWKDGRVPGRGDDVCIRDVELSVSGPLTVKSLRICGKAKVSFAAVPMKEIASTPENLYANATVIRVGDGMAIEDSAVVTVENDLKTGAAVKFEIGTFRLEADARLSADGTGWFWYESKDDPLATLTQGTRQTRAPGAGGDDVAHAAYNRGGGYGGKGGNANAKYGNDYGNKYAPFLPGSPNGIYDNHFNYTYRAGGTVWIACAGKCELYGQVSANGAKGFFGAPSGGGVWIAAKKLAVGPQAAIAATGGEMPSGYSSHGAGGRVSLALGLSARQLDELAAGKMPSGVTCVDAVGALRTDVRGSFTAKSGKYGADGTAVTVTAAGAAPIEVVKADYVFEPGRTDVRKPCLGHELKDGVVTWKWGGVRSTG